MPRKGFFTQCVCILLEKEVPLSEIESALSHLEVARRDVQTGSSWMSSDSLIIPFRPEVNGFMILDVVGQKWPDHMGDPKKVPELFAAWLMGHFGPSAFPGGLQRAVEQSWGWKDAGRVVTKHGAFIRILTSYVIGATDNTPTIPQDYDALDELQFLTDAAVRLLQLPSALCYFNPSGEVLATKERAISLLDRCQQADQPPLPLWLNVRLFNIDSNWSIMDTVGLEQLDLFVLCVDSDRFTRRVSSEHAERALRVRMLSNG
jgi:hypothetical protein